MADREDGVVDAYKLSSVLWQKKSYQVCHTVFELPFSNRQLLTALILQNITNPLAGNPRLNHKLLRIEPF